MTTAKQTLQEQARTQLPLSEATYFILLALLRSNHGYGIMQAVAAEGGIRIGPGTLYGALTNLLKQGLIRRESENSSADDRRKLYALTSLGRMVVEMECTRLETVARIGREFLKSAKGAK